MQPDKAKLTKRKTSTKKQTSEPKWNETVSYQLKEIPDWLERSVVVTVHDADKLKNNPEVGEFSVTMKEIVEQKKVIGWYALAK